MPASKGCRNLVPLTTISSSNKSTFSYSRREHLKLTTQPSTKGNGVKMDSAMARANKCGKMAPFMRGTGRRTWQTGMADLFMLMVTSMKGSG